MSANENHRKGEAMKEQEREELHRTIWSIANDLRGAVDGWDFKQYVLGMLFYRYISENLSSYVNRGERDAGDKSFDYASLSDAEAESARADLVSVKGFFILPSQLFANVRERAASDENLNETLSAVFRSIEDSARGTESESDFAGLFDDLDLYRFTSCFEMFLSSGEHQDQALIKSIPVVEGSALRDKLRRCADKMAGGMSFSQTAYEEKLYDPTNNRMLIPAERSGMLDEIMQKIMTNLRDSIDKNTGLIANTAEPLLTGVLMIFIGIMLISLMVPLIGIMNSIG